MGVVFVIEYKKLNYVWNGILCGLICGFDWFQYGWVNMVVPSSSSSSSCM